MANVVQAVMFPFRKHKNYREVRRLIRTSPQYIDLDTYRKVGGIINDVRPRDIKNYLKLAELSKRARRSLGLTTAGLSVLGGGGYVATTRLGALDYIMGGLASAEPDKDTSTGTTSTDSSKPTETKSGNKPTETTSADSTDSNKSTGTTSAGGPANSDKRNNSYKNLGAIGGGIGGGIVTAIIANKLANKYAKKYKTLLTALGLVGGGVAGAYAGDYLASNDEQA